MSINLAILSGRLGQDPNLKYNKSGKPMALLNVATSDWRKDSNSQSGYKEETDWHRVLVYAKQAENVSKYLKKGSDVTIVGKTKTRKYDDENKITRYITEIHASKVVFPRRNDSPNKRNEELTAAAEALIENPNDGRSAAALNQEFMGSGLEDIPY